MKATGVRLGVVACIALGVAGCGGSSVKDTLGINKAAPDETRVVSRPPLSVPPQFNLRAPGDGTSPQSDAQKKAESLVLGNSATSGTPANVLTAGTADTAVIPVTSSSDMAGAEGHLLQNAGANKADPSIREALSKEKYAQEEERMDQSWWNMFSPSKNPKDKLVDAEGEKERLETNKASGKPVTEGETPATSSKDTGVLGHIFGY